MARIKIGNDRTIELLNEKKNQYAKHINIGNFFGELTEDKKQTNGTPLLKLAKDGKDYYIREKFIPTTPQECDYYFKNDWQFLDFIEKADEDILDKSIGLSDDIIEITKDEVFNVRFLPYIIIGNNVKKFYLNHCSSLTSIPEKLLNGFPKLEQFKIGYAYSVTFIPENLFDKNNNIKILTNAFWNCKNVVSKVPELWLKYPNAKHSGCFYGAVKAANYNDIPFDWKQPN